jgi:hypothetical protein
MPSNGWRNKIVAHFRAQTYQPAKTLINVISFKYSTIRAMFYDRMCVPCMSSSAPFRMFRINLKNANLF